jgi:hypothetical protein
MNWNKLSHIMTRKLQKTRRTTTTQLNLLPLEDRATPAIFTVLNTNDSGSGSLRDAISQANSLPGADTIQFGTVFANPQTISLTSGQLSVTDPLTITGPGSGFLAIRSGNANATATNRIFNINATAATPQQFSISGMVLSGGNLSAGNSGAAILLDQDALTLTDLTITGNKAGGDGGAIQVASANATLVVQNSNLSKNTATGNGGAINIANSVTSEFSSVTISNSTVATNTAQRGGAINFTNNGELKILSSTLSGNAALSNSLRGAGGGVNFYGTPQGAGFVVSNSTLSGNTAANGSGGAISAANLNGPIIIRNSTVTGNTAGAVAPLPGGGGLAVIDKFGSGSVLIESSIVAANVSPQAPDIFVPGGLIGISFSLIGAKDNLNISGTENLSGTISAPLDPSLRVLGNYGGPTLTHRPLPGSPAIDKGSNSTGLGNDQRGTPFVRAYTSKDPNVPDIGSFEVQPLDPPFVTGSTLPNVTTPGGTTYTFTLTFTAEGGGSQLDTATMIGNNNAVIITGPNFFTASAKFVSINNGSLGTPRTLTLSITPPAGAWDFSDNGTYDVQLLPNQIGSTTGQFAPGGPVGSFNVNIQPTFVVTNSLDSGSGSLRQAVLDANANPGKDIIFFETNFFSSPRRIDLSTGFMKITESLSIVGPGSGLLTISGTPTFATPINRIFSVDDSGSVTNQDVLISGITLTGGNLNTGGGAAIFQNGDTLTLNDITVSGNSSSAGAGGIFVTGNGTLNLQNSRVLNNSATGNAVSGGGIFADNSTLNLLNSTVNGNTSTNGGGGIISKGGTLNITNSTISNNSANRLGGGLAGISVGSVTITNSTFSGNAAPVIGGGAMFFESQLANIVIRNSTITQNASGTAGGGGIFTANSPAQLQLTSSIVAGNTFTAAPGLINPDIVLDPIFGTILANKSLIGAFDNLTFSPDLITAQANNKLGQVGVLLNPLLGPLQNNGGPTLTHAPLAKSQAINNGAAGGLPTDQRGPSFVRVSGGGADIGAVEAQAPTLVSITLPTGGPTNLASMNATVTFNQAVSNLTASNFALVSTKSPLAIAQASGTIGTPTGGPLVWTVPVTNIAGTGTLQLNLQDGTGIVPAPTSSFFTGPVVAVDREAPTVETITRLLSSPTSASTLTFEVAFNEPVTGVNVTNFRLVTQGNVVGTISSVVGTPSTYTVTVTGVTGNGTLRLDMVNTNSVTDPAGNPVSNTPVQGEIYAVGAPIVLSATSVQGNFTNSSTVTFNVTFSQPVSGINFGTNLTANFSNMPSVIPTVTGTGPTTDYQVTFDGLAPNDPNGSLQLVINSAGVVPALGLVPFSGPTVTLDSVAPQVSSIALPDPTLTNLSQVRFTINFTESVQGLTASNLQLLGTLTGASIADISGSGSTYTVLVNTSAATGTLGLSVANNIGLTDLAGNLLSNPGFTSTLQYTVDRIAPQVVGIVRTGSTPTSLAQVQFLVTFNKPVTGVTISRFSLASSVGGSSIIGLSGSGTDYFVTVNTGVGDGSLGLNLISPAGIVDSAGNSVASPAAGQAYQILKLPPQVGSIERLDPSPTAANSVRYAVRFTKPVSGVDSGDFNLTVSGLTGAGITGVTGSSDLYTVVVSTGAGNGAFRLDLIDNDTIQDLAGNPIGGPGPSNGNSVGPTYSIDRAPPVASVSVSPEQVLPALAGPIKFLVQFDEPVIGFSESSLVIGGTSGANQATVTGSGDTYTVTVDATNRTGTITLAINPGVATDIAGNVTSGSTNQATVNVLPQPIPNRPPVAQASRYSAFAGIPLTISGPGVLTNAADPENSSLTAVLVSPPPASIGTVVVSADGGFRFTPVPGFLGQTSFTIAASDGSLTSTPVTVTIDVNPRLALLAVGAGPGGGPRVRVLNASDGSTRFDFFAYSQNFTGGVNVATGDINGDGIEDLITAVAGNGAPHIKLYDGATGTLIRQFFAYAPNFTGGVFVASGDVNGDGKSDVIVGAGVGGGPHVQVFDGPTGFLIRNFFAYSEFFRGGVNVAAGDVDGDGIADIVTGAGPGGGPHIRVYRGTDLAELQNLIVPDFPQSGGVNVTVADINGDRRGDIIAGAGLGSQVRVYDVASGILIQALQADDTALAGGVRVTTKDLTGDNVPDVLFLAPGPGGQSFVRRLRLPSLVQLEDFVAFESGFVGGVFVG